MKFCVPWVKLSLLRHASIAIVGTGAKDFNSWASGLITYEGFMPNWVSFLRHASIAIVGTGAIDFNSWAFILISV